MDGTLCRTSAVTYNVPRAQSTCVADRTSVRLGPGEYAQFLPGFRAPDVLVREAMSFRMSRAGHRRLQNRATGDEGAALHGEIRCRCVRIMATLGWRGELEDRETSTHGRV